MELYKELIAITRETFPKTLSEIEKAWDEKNFQKLKEIAHSIKGHAFSICCKRLAGIANEIELRSNALDSSGIDELIKAMRQEVNLLLELYLVIEN